MRNKHAVRLVAATAFGIISAFAVGSVVLGAQGYSAFRSFGALLNYSVFTNRALLNSLVRANASHQPYNLVRTYYCFTRCSSRTEFCMNMLTQFV